jgi:hypothetical protein
LAVDIDRHEIVGLNGGNFGILQILERLKRQKRLPRVRRMPAASGSTKTTAHGKRPMSLFANEK